MSTSLDELVRLRSTDADLVTAADPGREIKGIVDFELAWTGTDVQIKYFEYIGADGLPHVVGLVGHISQDVTVSAVDELQRLWGKNLSPVASNPEPAPKDEDAQILEYIGADGQFHRVGLLGENDSQNAGMTYSLDDLVSLWGEDVSLGVQNSTLTDILEFSLTAAEKQIKFFEIGVGLSPVGLSGKHVSQGVLLVRLLGKEVNPIVHQQTLMSLADLADSHEIQVKIGSFPGAVHALSSLLLEEDVNPSVLEQTARCLSRLSFADENRERIAAYPDVLDAVVSVLLKATSISVLDETVKCLINLTEVRANQAKIATYPGAFNALVRLMRENRSSSVREQAVRCLNNLAALQENEVKIVSQHGVLRALVSLLGNRETTKVQWQSAKCLATLASHFQQNKVDIASYPGMLDALVRLLKYNWITSDRISVQEVAADCLLNLTSEYQNLTKIALHPGTLDALVKCLGKYTSRRVQDLAAGCLRDLIAVPENQRKIATHPNALAAIVNMLLDPENLNPRGQGVAGWCISKLAIAEETGLIIVSHPGTLDALVSLLEKDTNSILLEPIIQSMVSFASLNNKQVKIASHPGVLGALVRILEKDVELSVLDQTARCLSLLASAPENQGKIISYPGALGSLLNLLQLVRTRGARRGVPMYTGVLAQTAKCLNNLAESQENQVRIASFPGILDELVWLLIKNLRANAQEEILRCLAKLSESQENQVKILSYPGVHDALMALTAETVDFWSARIQEQAARCLANLERRGGEDKYAKLSIVGQPSFSQRRQSRQFGSSLTSPHPAFVDPITQNIMCDPVKCSDGCTYDRWTIINFDIVRPPYSTRGMGTSFGIEGDDTNIRRRLFEAFPNQEASFFARRRKYREEALQHAHSGEKEGGLEGAVEKLNNVLKFAPSDIECRNERERILNVLEHFIDADRWDIDPITYERMCDPVKCNDGRTYDRWTIIDQNMQKCPYDSNLTPFGILVDDFNVRRRLFEEFPEQQAVFRTRRDEYREKALLHARNRDTEDAIRMLQNLLLWAPADKLCRKELKRNLNRLQEQMSRIYVVNHEDLVTAAKDDQIRQLALPGAVLFLLLGIWFVIEFGWLFCMTAGVVDAKYNSGHFLKT